MKSFKYVFLVLSLSLLLANVGYAGRYYDCRVARWLTPDPLMQKFPEVSPYNYCHDNPLNRIDIQGLTDITIHVQRFKETKNSTTGTLTMTNSSNSKYVSGYTLELPDKNNKSFVSRINADSYDAKLDKSDNLGDVVRLENKNDRKDILIHTGNKPDDVQGCIAAGKTVSEDFVGNSKAMMKGIIGYINNIISSDQKTGEETTITVVVSNPVEPKKQEQPRDGVGMVQMAN